MRPIISSEKHYVQSPIFTVAQGAIGAVNIISSVVVLSKNLSNEVEEGSEVRAVFCEYWATSDGAGQGSAIVTLEKIPSQATAQTFAQSSALATYPNKKNVLYTFQGLTANNTANPVPIIRQWIMIPKSKRRFGLSDRLIINFSAITDGLTICGFSTYKEYK